MPERARPLSIANKLEQGIGISRKLKRIPFRPRVEIPNVRMRELRAQNIPSVDFTAAKMLLEFLSIPIVEDHLKNNDAQRDKLSKEIEILYGKSGINYVNRNIFRANNLSKVTGPLSFLMDDEDPDYAQQFKNLFDLLDKRGLDNRTYKSLPTSEKMKIIQQYFIVAKIALNLIVKRSVPEDSWRFIQEDYKYHPLLAQIRQYLRRFRQYING